MTWGSSLPQSERPISADVERAKLARLKADLEKSERELTEAASAYIENPNEDTIAKRNRYEIARDRAARSVFEQGEKLAVAVQRESDPQNRIRYDETVRERAAVAKWLTSRYELLAKEIAAGIARLDAINQRTRDVNRNLPAGAPELDELEYALRRTGAGYSGELTDTVNLPSFRHGEPNYWPTDKVG